MGFQDLISLCYETRYLYQLDLYLFNKESAEENLGQGVALKTTESLQNSHCMVFPDNFFNSPSLILKHYERGLYDIGTAGENRKGILEMLVDRKSRDDFEYL